MDEITQLPLLLLLAKKVSLDSNYKIKMGCLIVKHGRIIGAGCNQLKTHTLLSYPNRNSIHAEVNAIRSTRKSFIKNSQAYIYREYKNGIPALAKPCPRCMEKLRNFGIKRIYYSIGEYPYFSVERL